MKIKLIQSPAPCPSEEPEAHGIVIKDPGRSCVDVPKLGLCHRGQPVALRLICSKMGISCPLLLFASRWLRGSLQPQDVESRAQSLHLLHFWEVSGLEWRPFSLHTLGFDDHLYLQETVEPGKQHTSRSGVFSSFV